MIAVPVEAVEAAERAVFDAWLQRNGGQPTTDSEWRAVHGSGPTFTKGFADAALAAAVPLIREQIAAEIEAQIPEGAWHLDPEVFALQTAADIARGGAK